jgi:molybdopterin/thiamine biosynthesis adenylyltransferase
MMERNKRQSFLGSNLDEVLRSCVVGVVGLGGGGSQIVQQLAHIGFRRYILCDFDTLESSNLNRLVGATVGDLKGRNGSVKKMDLAIRMIKGLVPEADIQEVHSKFQLAPEAFQSCDIIFGCLDGLKNRDDLENLCRSFAKPYFDIGMDVLVDGFTNPEMYGQVIASIPGKPCMRCFGYLSETNIGAEVLRYGQAGDHPQVIWPNATLSAMAVHMAINHLTNWTGQSEEQVLYYSYEGNQNVLKPHVVWSFVERHSCQHYPLR